MFRRFLIAVLIFLILIVVVIDRVGAIVAGHVLAGKVQTDEHLPNRPSASIGGFPFLTQAIGGKYSDVTIKASNVPINGVTVTTLTAHLHGVHLPLGKILHGVSEVPVDKVDGTAFVSFADANAYLGQHRPAGQTITLSPGTGDSASVHDRLRIDGKAISLHGEGSLSVSANVVTISVSQLSGAKALGSAAARAALQLAERRLAIAIPLEPLPFRIQVNSVSISPTGLTATGGATHIVLGSHG